MFRAARPTPAVAALLVGSVIGLMASSGDPAPQDGERWDRKYATGDYVFGTEPVAFLQAHIDVLRKGKALDLAMGEGRNAVYLASQGFEVTGLDVSAEGIKKAHALATRRGVSIETKLVDLESHRLPVETYDLIVCTYYLQRDLFPQIKHALKPGGMALVETYTIDHLKHRPDFPRQYLLEPNELLQLFEGMRVLRYQDRDDGDAAYASILVEKSARPLPVSRAPGRE